MKTFRLLLRANRFEMAGVTVLAIAVLALAGGLVARLTAAGIPDACWAGSIGIASCGVSRLDLDAYLSDAGTWGYFAIGGIAVLPILTGLLVGITMVGKELDRGTATFAWSLTPSRRRWLVARALPLAILVTVVSLLGGAFADSLEVLRNPGAGSGETFAHLTTRGVVVGAQALAFLGLAAIVGSVLGRILPALLLSAGIVVVAYAGVAIAADEMMRHETVTVVDPQDAVPGRVMEVLYQTSDGHILSWTELYERYGSELDSSEDGGESLGLRQVVVVIPEELYPIAVARMSVLFVAIGLAGLVLSAAVVDRRRPL
ncbi:MAG: hypothetical protein ABIZ52_08315 [Candidatus Limnocylindrales bacterium]